MGIKKEDGIIDITEFAEALRSTWVMGMQKFITTLLTGIPWLGWLAAPLIDSVFGWAITWVLNKMSYSALQYSYFINTAHRKSSQADEFIEAVEEMNNLPEIATEEDYARAEQKRIDAFERFVPLTN